MTSRCKTNCRWSMITFVCSRGKVCVFRGLCTLNFISAKVRLVACHRTAILILTGLITCAQRKPKKVRFVSIFFEGMQLLPALCCQRLQIHPAALLDKHAIATLQPRMPMGHRRYCSCCMLLDSCYKWEKPCPSNLRYCLETDSAYGKGDAEASQRN